MAIPTLVGNSIGMVVGFVVAIPLMPIEMLLEKVGEQDDSVVMVNWSAHILGFATGTPFLPFSYLFPVDRWMGKLPRHMGDPDCPCYENHVERDGTEFQARGCSV